MKKIVRSYLNEIAKRNSQGDAREESYYTALEALLQGVAQALQKKILVTILPSGVVRANPDFRIWDDANKTVIGYIEAKAPGTNLDKIEAT